MQERSLGGVSRVLCYGAPLALLSLLGPRGTAAQGKAESGVSPSMRAVGEAAPKGELTPRQRRSPSRRHSSRIPVRTAHAARPAAMYSSPHGAPALASDLGGILHSYTRSGRWGVMVASVTRGDILFAENADVLLKPASTLKMLTAGLALERFGPSHTFATQVLRDRPIRGGAVDGNLYLKGGGDPTLSTRFWQGESPMDALASQVAATGVRHVKGSIIADESAFATERIPQGWKRSYLMSSYAAPVSALSLNENIVWVVARPERGRAVVELDPPSTTISVTSSVRVVSGSRGRIVARRTAGGLAVSGTIGSRSAPRRYSLVVREPPTYAAGALEASLRKAGVRVDGGVRLGVAPKGADAVAEVHSLPLANIVSYMNRESINHFAELLLRDAARNGDVAVSVRDAEAALREFIEKKAGGRGDHIRVHDGSGLSEADSLTPRAMVQVLTYAHRAPWGPVFHASMPVAGESVLMRRRMRASPAQGNLHAKTGTTNTVAALAGYVTALNGEILAFTFIYNGNDRAKARTTMDRMGPTLANFARP